MEKRAVLIGVNNYNNGKCLKGCVNDVENMLDYLIEIRGFKKNNILVLTNDNATTENIKMYLENLINVTEEGDSILLYFSGSGTQIQNFDTDDTRKFDVLCPCDFDTKQNYISANLLKDLFSIIDYDVFVELILDCSYSGKGTRPFTKTKQITQNPKVSKNSNPFKIRYAFKKLLGKTVVWESCSENGISSDAFVNGKYQGAFTAYYLDTVKKYPTLSKEETLKEVIFQLKNFNFQQLPMLTVYIGD